MKENNNRALRTALAAVLACLLLAACSSIDCPLNNRVYATFKLSGTVTTLTDSLSVATTRTLADGSDTVLLNKALATDSFALPLSYTHEADTYYFSLAKVDTALVVNDTVVISKENQPHFESVDCNPTFFHTLTGISHTGHAIDSIVIHNPKVTYNDTQPHFLLYLKSSGN